MDDNLEDKKYFNNNILIESKNIRKGAKNFVSTKRKNRCTNKFYSYLNGEEQNQQNEIYSVLISVFAVLEKEKILEMLY